MTIVKLTSNGAHGRCHVATEHNRPVCGGGNGARSAEYQNDFGDPTCCRCLSIINGRQNSGGAEEKAEGRRLKAEL